jgi:hypothetical protein
MLLHLEQESQPHVHHDEEAADVDALGVLLATADRAHGRALEKTRVESFKSGQGLQLENRDLDNLRHSTDWFVFCGRTHLSNAFSGLTSFLI